MRRGEDLSDLQKTPQEQKNQKGILGCILLFFALTTESYLTKGAIYDTIGLHIDYNGCLFPHTKS